MHIWIEIGNRRWAMCCDHFQRRVNGKWKDDTGLIGAWPGYEPTNDMCPALEQYELRLSQ